MTDLSYQLYSSRNWPLDETLRMLAQTGYTQVEGYGGVLGDVGALKSLLTETGLHMTSAHFGVTDLETDLAGCLNTARDLGVTHIYAPYLQEEDRPTDIPGWEAFATRLAVLDNQIKAEGFVFGWHNHDFELIQLKEDWMPLDVIHDAGVALELDLGWVKFAGLDVVDTIKRYGRSIKTAHIKDRAPDGTKADEDGWDDVGHGVMDWAAIVAALREQSVDHFVIEHDNPSDHVGFAQRSFTHIASL